MSSDKHLPLSETVPTKSVYSSVNRPILALWVRNREPRNGGGDIDG